MVASSACKPGRFSAIVVDASWANIAIAIERLPAVTVAITVSTLERSLPGAQVTTLSETGLGRRRRNVRWRIVCSERDVTTRVCGERVDYAYLSVRDIPHDLTNLCMQILELAADQLPDAVVLHAAFVRGIRREAIITGPPFSGKSTLALLANFSGWTCRATERLVFNCRTLSPLAGTTVDTLTAAHIDRFFPDRKPGQVSVATRRQAHPDVTTRELIGIIPKVTTSRGRVRAVRLSNNMAFRILGLDLGLYASGGYYLNYGRQALRPGPYTDTRSRRAERARRLMSLCTAISAYLVEGPPPKILAWIDNASLEVSDPPR